MKASIIDYPRSGLDERIWNVKGKEINLQPKTRSDIEKIIREFLKEVNLPTSSLEDVIIYGSILTNQWNSNTDIDARVILDPEIVSKKYEEVTGDDLFEAARSILHGNLVGNTSHPFNATVVIPGEQTELAQHDLGLTKTDPIFSLRTNQIKNFGEWNTSSFDPDTEFEKERKSADELMQYLDTLIHDVRTKTIDVELLKEAIEYVDNPDEIISKLEEKISSLTTIIYELVTQYELIKKKRSEGYEISPNTMDHHKMPQNIIYKILDKYKYIDIMKKLKLILKNGIQTTEVEEIADAVNVTGAVDTRPISGVSPTAPPTSMTGPPGETEINMEKVPDGAMMHGASCPHCGYVNPLTAAEDGKEVTCQGCGKKFEMGGGENGQTDFFVNTAPSVEPNTAPYESDVPVYSKKGQTNLSINDLDSLKTMLKDLGVSSDILTKLDTAITAPAQQNPIEPTQAPEAPDSPSTVQPTKDNLSKVKPALTPNKNIMSPLNKTSSFQIGNEYKQKGIDFYAAILPEMSEPELKEGYRFRVQWFSSKENLGHSSYSSIEEASADVIEELGFELERADGAMDKFALAWKKESKMKNKKAWFDEPTNRDPGGSPYPPDQNLADASSEKEGTFEKTDDDITMEVITILDGQDIAPFLEDDALLEDLLQMFPMLGKPNKKIDQFCFGCPLDKEEKVAVGEPQDGKGQYVAPTSNPDFEGISMTAGAYVGLCPNCKTLQIMEYDKPVRCTICTYPIPPYKDTHPDAEPPPGYKTNPRKETLTCAKSASKIDLKLIRTINDALQVAGFDGNGRGFTESYKVINPIKATLESNGLKIGDEAESDLTNRLLLTLRGMENMSPDFEQKTQNVNLPLFDIADIGLSDMATNCKLSISWYPLVNINDLEVLAYISH